MSLKSNEKLLLLDRCKRAACNRCLSRRFRGVGEEEPKVWARDSGEDGEDSKSNVEPKEDVEVVEEYDAREEDVVDVVVFVEAEDDRR